MRITVIIFLLFSVSGLLKGQVLTTDELLPYVNDKIPNYRSAQAPKASQIRIGDITYTMCQKEFREGKKRIKVLLFDFKEASIMYIQATRGWLLFESLASETYIQRPLSEEQYVGWETYNIPTKTAKIHLGIHDRFLMTIETTDVSPESLQEIIDHFMNEEFPF